MLNPTGPSKFTGNMAIILIVSVLSVSGYVLVSIRYGGPVRESKTAVRKVQTIQNSIPGIVERKVDRRIEQYEKQLGALGELSIQSDTMSSSSEGNSEPNSTISQIQLDQLEDRIQSSESKISELTTTLESLQFELDYYKQIAQTYSDPNFDSTWSESDRTNPAPQSASASVKDQRTIASDLRGGVQVDIMRAWSNGENIVLEVTLTQTESQDGYFSVRNSRYDSKRKRVVTSIGTEITGFRINKQGKVPGFDMTAELVSFTPMQHTIHYRDGIIPDTPFMATRIEFVAYTDRAQDLPLIFQFENVVISGP